MKITIEDFKEYVAGFLMVGEDDGLSHQNMLSALHNAYSQLMDDQDGIEALTERTRNSHNHVYRSYNGNPLEITDLNEIQYLFDLNKDEDKA